MVEREDRSDGNKDEEHFDDLRHHRMSVDLHQAHLRRHGDHRDDEKEKDKET